MLINLLKKARLELEEVYLESGWGWVFMFALMGSLALMALGVATAGLLAGLMSLNPVAIVFTAVVVGAGVVTRLVVVTANQKTSENAFSEHEEDE